ncbi:MAG: NAD(P)-binding domain-containing protein, partial [Rhodomicrobiaceae bacterium]
MAKISFIGLGNMGLPMAQNLAKAGHDVIGFDALPAAREAATSAGLIIGESNSQVAETAEIIILMLPNGQIVQDVAREILTTLPKGSLLIDCSTI